MILHVTVNFNLWYHCLYACIYLKTVQCTCVSILDNVYFCFVTLDTFVGTCFFANFST